MAKRCRTFEHPCDLGLDARADSLGELFEAVAEGVARHLCPGGVSASGRRRIRARSEDRELLLVEFLGELLGLFHRERFLPAEVRVEKITEHSVWAEVAGEPYDPARHELGPEIKAVTYHQLKVAREGDAWVARVILDL